MLHSNIIKYIQSFKLRYAYYVYYTYDVYLTTCDKRSTYTAPVKYVYYIERPDRLFIINGHQTTFFTYDKIVTKQKHTKILQTK